MRILNPRGFSIESIKACKDFGNVAWLKEGCANDG